MAQKNNIRSIRFSDELGELIDLLPDLLLNLPKLFLLPGQLPHAAGNQILEFLRVTN